MEKLFRYSFGLIGAIIGFVLGMFLAFAADFSEKPFVFTFAAITSAALSILTVVVSRNFTKRRLSNKKQTLFACAAFACAAGTLALFIKWVAHA